MADETMAAKSSAKSGDGELPKREGARETRTVTALPQNPFLWPLFVAASTANAAASFFNYCSDRWTNRSDIVVDATALDWTTPNDVRLELPSMRLRDFSEGKDGPPALLCAPFSLHEATIADFASGYSVVEALRQSGLARVFVTDWRSATPEMRYFSIDAYLADINVAVDEIGPPVDLIGLCQGGWMALVYAARFPDKVRRLVLVGAPVDIRAGNTTLTQAAVDMPLSAFETLVRNGDGRLLGQHMLPPAPMADEIDHILQEDDRSDSEALRELRHRFERWYASTVDLPGVYYLQVVQQLFKENRIAEGRFVALGRTIDLATIHAPIFLLAGSEDDLVHPDQLLGIVELVGTPKHCIETAIEACGHLSLFLGSRAMAGPWQRIGHWLRRDMSAASMSKAV